MQAVIDRIEDGKHAVLIVGGEERQKVITADKLPDGAQEGTWLQVVFDGDTVASISIDEEETEKRQRRISSKMEKLKERKKKK